MKNRQLTWPWILIISVVAWAIVGVAMAIGLNDWSLFKEWSIGALLAVSGGLVMIVAKKLSLPFFRFARRFIALHWRGIASAIGVLIVVRIAVPCPIRGNYAGSFTAHGCAERAFLRLVDGQIHYYHGGLMPELKGRYERIGRNTYAWRRGSPSPNDPTIKVGWFFVRLSGLSDEDFWLHRDLSFASDRMVETNSVVGTSAGAVEGNPPELKQHLSFHPK